MLDFGRNEILGPLAFRSLWSGIAAWWCGSSVSSGSVTAPTASALAGNWLIVGPMPTVPFLGTTTPPEHFRLALTIDTVGDQIVAAGFANYFCPNFQGSYGFPSVLQGTLAQEGTVSLQSSVGKFSSSGHDTDGYGKGSNSCGISLDGKLYGEF